MVLKWEGGAPPDAHEWFDVLFDELGEEATGYWVRFYQQAGAWRFDLEQHGQTPGPDGWSSYRRADESTALRVFTALVQRGKPLDPTWNPSTAASPIVPPDDWSRAEFVSIPPPAPNPEPPPLSAFLASARQRFSGWRRLRLRDWPRLRLPSWPSLRLPDWRGLRLAIGPSLRIPRWRRLRPAGWPSLRLLDWRKLRLPSWPSLRLPDWRGLRLAIGPSLRVPRWRRLRPAGWPSLRLPDWRKLRLPSWPSLRLPGWQSLRLPPWRGLRLPDWRKLRLPSWPSLRPALVYTPAILLAGFAGWLSRDRLSPSSASPAAPAALSQVAQTRLGQPDGVAGPSRSDQASLGRRPNASMPVGITQRPPTQPTTQRSPWGGDETRPRTRPPRRGEMVDVNAPGVMPPVLVSRSHRLPYPPLALAHGLSGRVRLNALVDETGRVLEIALVSTSAPGLGFEDAAMTQVYSRVYRPATKQGVSVRVRMPIEVDFPAPGR